MAWEDLRSSNVSAMEYVHHQRRLNVRFQNGQEYAYDDVPPEVANGLRMSESPGKFVATALKPAYTGTLKPPPEDDDDGA